VAVAAGGQCGPSFDRHRPTLSTEPEVAVKVGDRKRSCLETPSCCPVAQRGTMCDIRTMRGPESPPAGQAIIGIARHNLMSGLLRSYSVFIDRQLVGRLWTRQSGSYVVSPGHHEVCLRVGRRKMAVSPQMELDVNAGDVRSFRTGSKRLVLSWGSLLRRYPDWETGPWVTLKPWPHSTEDEVPAVRHPGHPSERVDLPGINGVTFRRTLKGYNAGEVDQFLKGVSGRIQTGDDVSAQELSDITFHLSLNGYDIAEVDAYIGTIAKATGGHPRSGGTG
jgi:DivIVA domain-containing protein